MNRLFGLFLLALACWAPDVAQAANKFWVGGTGSWSDTTHWATSSGGAGSTGIPINGDNVTFDGASGSGTVTADHASGLSIAFFTAGAFTGTIDWSLGGNPNMTITGTMIFSGSGLNRVYKMGSGTFTFTSTSAATALFDLTTTTNLDTTNSVFTANFTYSATTANSRIFAGGGRTYGTLTLTNTSRGPISITGANTFGSLSLGAGTVLSLPQSVTTTVSNAFTATGTSSNPIYLGSASGGSTATLSVPSGTVTFDYAAIRSVIATGGATFNATNSYDLGGSTNNSGWTITPPSGGGTTITVGGFGFR